MAIWATNTKRGLIPGTVGISIAVIEYDAETESYQAVSSAAYRPADVVPLPTVSYPRPESAPVSPVRPFVLAGLIERKPHRGTRSHTSVIDGDER